MAKACSVARFTAEDAASGLADAALMARAPQSLDLSHPWNITADRAIEIAEILRGRGTWGSIPASTIPRVPLLGTHQGLHVYGNTHGFVGGYPTTSHTVSCVVLAGTGEDMQRDYWYGSSRDWQELEQAEAIGQKARARTIARLGPRKLSTRRASITVLRPGNRARLDRALRGCDSRQQPVPPILVSSPRTRWANRCFRPDSPSPRGLRYTEGNGQRPLRR